MRSLWLAKKSGRYVALRWVRDEQGQVQTETVTVTYADGVTRQVRRPLLEIFEPKSAREVENGTVAKGSATCPVTGYTTPVASVRRQLKERRGGANDARLFAVATTQLGEQGRFYRLANTQDLVAVTRAVQRLSALKKAHTEQLSLVPNESTQDYHTFVNRGPIYGMITWEDYFTPRQSLALITLVDLIRRIGQQREFKDAGGLMLACQTILGLALSRFADICNSLCMWENTKTQVRHVFSRQALPMLWDFAEPRVLSDAAGNYDVTLNTMIRVLERPFTTDVIGSAHQASVTTHPLPDDSTNALITDPPYYYSVQYADLSDFFYVWLRRTLIDIHRELFKTPLTPKDDEIIVQSPGHEFASEGKNNAFYEARMKVAMEEGRRILAPLGIGVVVFAHTSTSGWEAQLQSMVNAGWIITGSWPIDTEMSTRVIAQNRAVLASSIHLVCRPREVSDGTLQTEVGDWRDVLQELPQRIHEWLPRLAREGIVGADAIFACLGPALEIFSRYSRVEKASGDQVPLKEYLEYVWAAVSKEALSMIFEGADATGFEEDARLTAMWLWTLSTDQGTGNGSQAADEKEPGDDDEESGAGKKALSGGFILEYDAARKIAQGLGAHMERLPHLVEIKGDKARLLPVSARTGYLFGKEEDQAPALIGRRKKGTGQLSFLETVAETDAESSGWGEKNSPSPGQTALDQVHQSMILFAAGRSEALRTFLVDEGIGRDPRFWRLANALSALYPSGTDEKRWIDGVLARKKGLGF